MNKYVKYSLIGLLILGLGVGIGRFSKPAEVKTITKTEVKEVIKIVEVKQENKNVVVKTKKTTHNDGTIVEESILEDKTVTKVGIKVDSLKESSSESISVTKRDTGLTIQALALTTDLKDINNNLEYGVLIKKRIIGNVSASVIATHKGTVGLAAGLDF